MTLVLWVDDRIEFIDDGLGSARGPRLFPGDHAARKRPVCKELRDRRSIAGSARQSSRSETERAQRLENWKLRRALALPYFLRSTTRGSRVRKPPDLSSGRKAGSKVVSARLRPWRT